MLHRSAVQAAVSLGYLTDLTDRERPVRPTFFFRSTVETAYKVYVLSRGNLLYMQIYLISDLKLL